MKEWLKIIGSALLFVAVTLIVFWTAFYVFILMFIFAGYQVTMIIYITLTFAAIFGIKKLA